MHRSLPGHIIDLIRDGVAGKDLRSPRRVDVQRALYKTALAANDCGWGVIEWETVVLEDRNLLAWQVRHDGAKALSDKQVQERLTSAWDKAVEWRNGNPAWNSDDARAEVAKRVQHLEGLLADTTLTDSDHAVLTLILALAQERGSTRVTLARRRIQQATGLGLTAMRNALRRLLDAGLLVELERGQPRGPQAMRHGRAAVYGLPECSTGHTCLCWVPQQVVPPAIQVVPPSDATAGAPAIQVVPPEPTATSPGEPKMITLTVSANDPEGLAQAIAALARLREAAPSVEELPASTGERTDNVVQFRAGAREA